MPEHQQLQYEFAAHLRNPAVHAAPAGIEDRRMAIYRRLFFNNIRGFLSQAFPVLAAVLGDTKWTALLQRFYADHKCQRPQFYQLAEEFVEYLQAGGAHDLPAFALELAHYEWVELLVAIEPGTMPEFDAVDQIEGHMRLVLTPFLRLLSYHWPVHQIGPIEQPEQAPQLATFLLVYRAPDESVRFKQLNAVSAALLESLIDSCESTAACIDRLAEQTKMPAQTLLVPALKTLNDLMRDGVVLGRQRSAMISVNRPE